MYARYMLLLGLEPKKNSPEEVRMKHTIHTIKKKSPEEVRNLLDGHKNPHRTRSRTRGLKQLKKIIILKNIRERERGETFRLIYSGFFLMVAKELAKFPPVVLCCVCSFVCCLGKKENN